MDTYLHNTVPRLNAIATLHRYRSFARLDLRPQLTACLPIRMLIHAHIILVRTEDSSIAARCRIYVQMKSNALPYFVQCIRPNATGSIEYRLFCCRCHCGRSTLAGRHGGRMDFKLGVEKVHQTTTWNDLRMWIVQNRSVTAQMFAVDAFRTGRNGNHARGAYVAILDHHNAGEHFATIVVLDADGNFGKFVQHHSVRKVEERWIGWVVSCLMLRAVLLLLWEWTMVLEILD